LQADVQAVERAKPRVEVVAPALILSDRPVQLPGSIQPLEETIIRSRADGYVNRWLVDIGDKVKDGQPLAEIDAPELDKQLAQARAQLAQAQAAVAQSKANRTLSDANLTRYEQLGRERLVAASDIDQRRAQAAADEANVSAAESNASAQRA